MTTFIRNRRLRWYGDVLRKEGRGGYHKEDVKHSSAGKEKKGRPKKERWLDNFRDDMKEYKMTKDMAQNRRVWHMKTKAGPLLHGGGLYVRKQIISPTRSLGSSWTSELFVWRWWRRRSELPLNHR